MKYFILFFISLNVYSATKVEGCGSYDIYGEVKKNSVTKSYDLVVNSGTISQYTFALSGSQERQIISYSGHSLKVRADILSKVSGYQGKLDTISKIDYSTPDPANFQGKGGFELIKKGKCK